MGIVILNVLKVIGVIILVILAFVLFLLLCILFIPIGYKVKASYDENLDASATITWFFLFIKVKVLFDTVLHIRASICGITCYDNLKPKKEKKHKKQKKEKQLNNTKIDIQSEHSTKETISIEEKSDELKQTIDETDNASSVCDNDTLQEKSTIRAKICAILDKIKGIWNNILAKINGIKEKLIGIKDKITCTKEKILYYLDLLQKQETKDALSLCIRQLVKILKGILPKKWKINATIGLEDSAMVGKILGIHGMLYPLIGNHINIFPIWDEVIMSGNLMAKGRISIISIVICALRLLIDKKIRNLIKVIKKGGNKNG